MHCYKMQSEYSQRYRKGADGGGWNNWGLKKYLQTDRQTGNAWIKQASELKGEF